jgi:hypothetical protein
MALRSSAQPPAQAATPSENEAISWTCSWTWPAADSEPTKRYSYLETVPVELVLTILELCDIKELLACQLVRVQSFSLEWRRLTVLQPPQTCRTLRGVISNSVGLRYKLALCKHGMCDGSRNGLSKAEKLGLLTAYVTAWGEIDSAVPEEVELFAGLGYPLDVSGNTLVFYKPVGQNKVPGPHRELFVCRTPSAIRRIELAHWVLTVPFGITDICIDASQDLLIYCLYVCHQGSRFACHNLIAGGFFFSGVLGFTYARCPVGRCIPRPNTQDLLYCTQMAETERILIILARVEITSLPAWISAKYPSGTGRRDNTSLTR